MPAELIEPEPSANRSAPNAMELTETQVVMLRGELPQPASACDFTRTGVTPSAPDREQDKAKDAVGEGELQPEGGDRDAMKLEISTSTTAQDLIEPHGAVSGVTPAPSAHGAQQFTTTPNPATGLTLSIGAKPLTMETITRVQQQIKAAPPQPFDLARQVRVYTALVRFVELEATGLKLEGKTISLPPTLPLLATKDRDLKERLNTRMKVLEKLNDAKFKRLRKDIDDVRKNFCKSMGPTGSVVLVQAQRALEKRVEELTAELQIITKALAEEIDKTITDMRNALVPEIARAVLDDPPDAFRGQFSNDEKGAKEFVLRQLDRVLPKGEDLVKAMSIRLTFKDVTFTALKDDEFRQKVLTSFSRSALPEGLHREFDAAQAKQGEFKDGNRIF